MNRIRQRPRGSGRSTLVLSSVLALLALACFPIFAEAAGSGTVEYDPGLPNDGGKAQNEQIAKSSESPEGSGGSPTGSTDTGQGSYSDESPSSEGGGTATKTGDGGKGEGNPGKGNNPPAKAGVQAGAPVAEANKASTDDGGSSPLVPILIAIAVLAAISIAAVAIRQRRQRSDTGTPLSTKAG